MAAAIAARSAPASAIRTGLSKAVSVVEDVDASARRLLILIDGLGAQKVIRGASGDEIKHIASCHVASELTSPIG